MYAPKMGQTADNPPKDCFAVYKVMLQCGLRLPANDFVNEILAKVGQAPAQVTYNSWVILTAFQVACHVAGVETSVDLFQYMYKIATFSKDYTYFSQRANKNLTLVNMVKKDKWEPYFFFVSANAFGEKVPSHFCVKTVNFKCNRPDIELEYVKLSKRFTRRLLQGAYLDEDVLRSCNIYKDANKRPKEDAYDLLLKVNDVLVQSAKATNNKLVLKWIENENLRSGIPAPVVATDVSIAFKPSEQDSAVALSPRLGGATSSTAKVSPRPLEVKAEKLSILDEDVDIIDLDKFVGCKNTNSESNDLPVASRFPFISSRVKTEKVSTLDASADEDVEIIDLDEFLGCKKKSSFIMTPSVRSSVPASTWLETSAGKRQADKIPEGIPLHLKRKWPNNERDADMVVEHMETGEMPVKEHKRKLGSAPKVSSLNDQGELDSISVQLDAILKKGTQSLQETSDHRLQMTNILASLDYCHLEASLEKTARQVSNLRDQVNLMNYRHAKLETCLKSYNQQVSDCKSNIEVLNSVRARLETFGLKECPQEVSRLEVQVVQLNSILAQLDASVERSAQLKTSLEMSEQQVSSMEVQVELLIAQNSRFDDAPLKKSRTEFQSSLNEFNRLEESLKMSAKNVGDLTNQVGQLTAILAQFVVDVEQANSEFKVSSASTKSLYEKARLEGLGRRLAE